MGSNGHQGHQGHQNLPFGYDPTGVHGIGLPSFISQQPTPTGQPLLNDQENEQMHDFFSTFESEAQSHGHHMSGHFNDDMSHMHLQVQMPHTYVGHETYVRSPTMDWHPQQMNGFQYPQHINHMNIQTPTSPFGNNHHVASPVNQMFPMNQSQMHHFSPNWQQQYPNPAMHSARPDLPFGTDPNFLNSGYAAPDGSIEADMSLISYAMVPASSASNTQPNSRPGSNGNTQPSSPVTTKKRKRNVLHTDGLRMTNGNTANGIATKQSPPPTTSTRKQQKSFVKHEQQPITPLSKTPTTHDEDELVDEDAEYEEDMDDEQVRSPSPPAPWPASKAPPVQKPPLPPKPPRNRKKSQSSASPAKPKMRRASSSATAATRVPLTAEQKKANHTNSEQRRRDATAKSYADLYDLVPEIQQMGKQSTMKKLEVVVEKVTAIKQQLEHIRTIMGRDPVTGQPLSGQIVGNQFGGDAAHVGGW